MGAQKEWSPPIDNIQARLYSLAPGDLLSDAWKLQKVEDPANLLRYRHEYEPGDSSWLAIRPTDQIILRHDIRTIPREDRRFARIMTKIPLEGARVRMEQVAQIHLGTNLQPQEYLWERYVTVTPCDGIQYTFSVSAQTSVRPSGCFVPWREQYGVFLSVPRGLNKHSSPYTVVFEDATQKINDIPIQNMRRYSSGEDVVERVGDMVRDAFGLNNVWRHDAHDMGRILIAKTKNVISSSAGGRPTIILG